MLNPFRYRSYYYDTETGLYYLQTRYYDPEIGRFINMDGIDYADPETINGLNLYAYCGNNPVMYVDPTGHSFLAILIVAAIAGAIIGAAAAGVEAYKAGGDGLDIAGAAILGGIAGAAVGGISAAIGGVGASMIGSGAAAIGAGLSGAAGVGALSMGGAQVLGGSLLVGGVNGLNVWFSKNGDRFGQTKIGSNQYYNRQFDDFWNQYGNKNQKTRREFHDYITKKGYDTWSQLKKAWQEFKLKHGGKL